MRMEKTEKVTSKDVKVELINVDIPDMKIREIRSGRYLVSFLVAAITIVALVVFVMIFSTVKCGGLNISIISLFLIAVVGIILLAYLFNKFDAAHNAYIIDEAKAISSFRRRINEDITIRNIKLQEKIVQKRIDNA